MPDNTTTIAENDFKGRMEKLSDKKLIEVLRKRDLYRKEAVEVAIQEAIKRKLIHSEEDLQAPQFRTETLKTKLFPDVDNPAGRKKIRKSIGRSFLIAGVLPVIQGIVQISNGLIPGGLMVLAFGLAWIGTSAGLIRQFSFKAVFILLALTALSLIYTLKLLITDSHFVIMNWLIAAAIYLLIAYGLIFVLRLKT